MSIKKIAEIVGVSPATVSRVLNNPKYKCANPDIREKYGKRLLSWIICPTKPHVI